MGKNQINVALLGLGRIGQKHAENLINHKSFKLKYTLNWQPENNFITGINKTINWYLFNQEWIKKIESFNK